MEADQDGDPTSSEAETELSEASIGHLEHGVIQLDGDDEELSSDESEYQKDTTDNHEYDSAEEAETVKKRKTTSPVHYPAYRQPQGIQKLPVEVLAFIFEIIFQEGDSHKPFMRVCRQWEDVIACTPNLWKRLTITSNEGVIANLASIKRRLRLSGSVALDVRLNADELPPTQVDDDNGINPSSTFDLFRHLSAKPRFSPIFLLESLKELETHRWRSMTLGGSFQYSTKLDEIGLDFAGLQDVTLTSTYSDKPENGPLFTILGLSAPPLRSLRLNKHQFSKKHIPERLLSDLRCIETSPQGYYTLLESPPPNFHTLHLTVVHEKLKEQKTIPFTGFYLPEVTSISSCSTSILFMLQLGAIRHLTINSFRADRVSAGTTIAFPVLESLSIDGDGLSSLVDISAPNLDSLRVGLLKFSHAYKPLPTSFSDNEDATILFKELRHHVMMDPKILRIHQPLPTQLMMLVLTSWPQLEEISLRIGPSDAWRGRLVASLRSRREESSQEEGSGSGLSRWKFCPNLRWLQLITDWDDEKAASWKVLARDLMDVREGELTSISWIRPGYHEILDYDVVF